MKIIGILIFLVCSCAPVTQQYAGLLKGVKYYRDPIDETLLGTDQMIIRVYGRVLFFQDDSVFIITKEEDRFIKLKHFNELYLIK